MTPCDQALFRRVYHLSRRTPYARMTSLSLSALSWWLSLSVIFNIPGKLFVSSSTNSSDIRDESQLVSYLLRGYKERGTGSRPVVNATQPIQVRLNVWLIQTLEFDIKQQVISTLVWKDYEWKDEYLTWDPAEAGGRKRVFFQPHEIWTPDIELYNSIDDKKVEKHDQRVTVWYNGTVGWVPHLIYHSTCPVDVTDFPFDSQVCTLKFGSWVYADEFLQLSFTDSQGFILTNYIMNGEWDLLHTNVTQETSYFYGDRYTTLHFKMTLKRNSGMWVRLILLPMIILSAITCLVFWIPPHRPDRTTISMSLFSSFFLLLLLIVQSAPPTSATRLVTCCTINIVTVALALVLSVISVNLYGGQDVWRKGACKNVCGGKCNKRAKGYQRGRSTTPPSPKKEDMSGGPGCQTAHDIRRPRMSGEPKSDVPGCSSVVKTEGKPELSRSQRLALTLDTVAFILFLANFVVIICFMHMVPPFQ